MTTYLKPWGLHSLIYDDIDYKVKKLWITKGNRISLQKHYKRGETWVVVRGHPKVTKGNTDILMKPQDCITIEKGEVHRIEAVEDNVLIIEVQHGICEEEDIYRLEDDYDRVALETNPYVGTIPKEEQ